MTRYDKYNHSEKGKKREKRRRENMTTEQKEAHRRAKREYARRIRAIEKEDNS
jgi:hypothetical protein